MNRIDRRTYLAGLVGGAAAIAGCVGDEGGTVESDEAGDVVPPSAVKEASGLDDETGVVDSDLEGVEDEDESDASNTDFAVGRVLEMGELQVAVSGFDRKVDVVDASSGDVLGAEDGMAFAVVDLALKHDGTDGILSVDEQLSVELGDGDGESYDRFVAADSESIDPTASRLAPGEVTRGDLVYEIAADSEGLALTLAALTNSAEYVVDLETEDPTESTTLLEQNLTDEPRRFGQGVEIGDVAVTVRTLEQGNNLGGFLQSDAGTEIVAVGVTIENQSGRERTILSGQSELKDEYGRSYHDVPRAVGTLQRLDGRTVKDGDVHEGKIAYQIEEGLSELYWTFDFAEWGDDHRTVWKLR